MPGMTEVLGYNDMAGAAWPVHRGHIKDNRNRVPSLCFSHIYYCLSQSRPPS
jgi:hypothetical protein